MSVPKSKRKQSKFEVYNTVLNIRRSIADIVLVDFKYDVVKFQMAMNRRYQGLIDPTPEQLEKKAQAEEKYKKFDEFFMVEEKKAILHYLRCLIAEVFSANSIYPEYYEEAIERRIHQDQAIGYMNLINQELQFVIDSLPVGINSYLKLVPKIEEGIKQLKAWRKSDNGKLRKLAGGTPVNSTNFANVNSNGNSNCNNASNVIGVRPIPRDGRKLNIIREGGVFRPC